MSVNLLRTWSLCKSFLARGSDRLNGRGNAAVCSPSTTITSAVCERVSSGRYSSRPRAIGE